ncbi:DUF5683 domain-containing protein [Aquimarina sp. ERC-38]|uniref:DUF5683 domain-containing protein n=1 Tax=Aquimarina sp. ERC-38 TaxID=2949996 RepID=UPI002245A8B0|nr:DUF5683 domain-containing protein [Aquimarina sp. ERC-38]UZO79454.1 DUF5683 domain-containing protein [Aquimarina sp. ERC-38]
MKSKPAYIFLIVLVFTGFHVGFGQENKKSVKQDSTSVKIETEADDLTIEAEKTISKRKLRRRLKRRSRKIFTDPLAPARAAFYSAALPGLGQIYTGNYWKLPLVYGAIGGGIYAYTWNNDRYNRFRDAFKRRLAGFTDDEFFGVLLPDGTPSGFSNEQLIDRQRRFRRDQELALLATVAAYALNIIDANVSAHLKQYEINEDLSLKPDIKLDDNTFKPNYSVSLRFNF